MSTSLVLAEPAFVQEYPELQNTGVPDWLPFAIEQTVMWLTLSYEGSHRNGGSENTTKNYAIDLGVPRAMQTWREPVTGKRGRRSPGPRPQAFLRWCAAFDVNPFTDIDVDLAHAWTRYGRYCGDADTTLHRRVGAISAWYSAMRRREHTTIVFADLITRQDRENLGITVVPASPTVAAPLAVVQAVQVAALLDPSPMRTRNRVIAELLPGTGLRAAELCNLDIDDLHRSGPGGVPALYVRGKGGKYRWVGLDDHQLALIDDYLLDRVPPDTGIDVTLAGQVGNRPAVAQPLLTSINGRRLSTQAVTYVLNRLGGLLDPTCDHPIVAEAALVLANAGRLHPHQLRHAHAQEADDAGASLNQIRLQLGHASLATTQLYLDNSTNLRKSTSVVVSRLIREGVDLSTLPTDGIRLRDLPELEDETEHS
ncbi:tyrosine-type recombinase/integrase [Amycolatopsis sp. RTGN1]|uniref:tyrosine-type recombinase/integrase n=1 Tax=Amycolatopsis ponsaeliensis TaxID=2992142 RepID=UPI00254D8C2E|nr:tyrosine-type recombinase/integrase [Amycolatopsis sp. RTGN1]